MSKIEDERYIPYLSTAEAIMETDGSPESFLRSIFPDATEEQLIIFRLYSLGKLHDGILLGLDISGRNPIGEVEAYQIGVQEGLDWGQDK